MVFDPLLCSGPAASFLDDFLTMGPPDSTRCQQHADIFLCFVFSPRFTTEYGEVRRACFVLGIPWHRIQGSTRLPRLRQGKVDGTRRLLLSWSRKTSCTRRQLESPIGSFHHTCRSWFLVALFSVVSLTSFVVSVIVATLFA